MTMMISQDPILYSSLGMGDTIVLFLLALVVFGPKRLPEIGRQIGKLYGEFRRASNEFKFQIEDELRKSEEEENQKKLETAPVTPQILPPSSGEIVAHHQSAAEPESLPIGETVEEPRITDQGSPALPASQEVQR